MRTRLLLISALFVLAAAAMSIKHFYSAATEAAQVIAETKETAATAAGITDASTDTNLQPAAKESAAALKDAEKREPRFLSIIAAGDIMLGRGVGTRLEKQNRSYIYPFEKVAGILRSGDVVFSNLEAPITDKTHSLDPRYKYILKNKPNALDSITYAGFNILNLANNHMMDYYAEGMLDTVGFLDGAGIAHAGAGGSLAEARKPAIIEKKGVRIGVISYTDMAEIVYRGNPQIMHGAADKRAGVVPLKYEYISEDMKKLRPDVDLLIVSLHWGVEESFEIPSAQVELAHRLLDEGADMIIGHHPHQFQGIEVYKGKPVLYSLGNFIFDQNDPENQEGFIIKMSYEEKKLIGLEAIPVRTIEKTQVVPVKGADASDLLVRERDLSLKLGTEADIKDDSLYFKIK